MISFDQVSKKYKGSNNLALASIDLKINNGEILGLVGLNGAGKTTAIKIASGVIRPTSGIVKVDGVQIERDPETIRRHVGWIPDVDNFESGYKALEQMKYYCGLYGMTREERIATSTSLLIKVGLRGNENDKLSSYSHGMKKRFMIAAALIANPHNLLFDEPFDGLDPDGARLLSRIIFEAKQANNAVLVSSHHLSDLEEIADVIVIIHKGTILYKVDLEKLKKSYKKVIKIRVGNPDTNLRSVLKNYGEVLLKEDMITVFDSEISSQNLEQVKNDLVSKGYMVIACDFVNEKLEDLFFRIIEQT